MLTRFFRTTCDLFDQPLLDAIPRLVALSLPLRVPTIFPLELLGRFAAIGGGGHGDVLFKLYDRMQRAGPIQT